MLFKKMLRFAQIGLLAVLLICAAFWGGKRASSVETAEARSSCFGPEDCKQHADYVPLGNALTSEQAEPSKPPPAPTPGGAGGNVGLAANEVSVRACDAQSDSIVERLQSDFQHQGVDVSGLKAASRTVCLLIEQEKYKKVQYTLPVVPQETANACAVIMSGGQPPSYEKLSNCLDEQLARLPRPPSGSALLQNVDQADRLFWTLQECHIFRQPGGSCIIH